MHQQTFDHEWFHPFSFLKCLLTDIDYSRLGKHRTSGIFGDVLNQKPEKLSSETFFAAPGFFLQHIFS